MRARATVCGIAVCLMISAAIVGGIANVAGAAWSQRWVGAEQIWSIGGVDRFKWNSPDRQWWAQGTLGGWQVLTAKDYTGPVVCNGAPHDLGNGFTYTYNSVADLGTFKKGAQDRFAYFYNQARWLNMGNTGGWQNIGKTGLSASFLGDGNAAVWRNLGNGFTFAYSLTGDLGLFRRGGTTARFAYYYTPGQWVDMGNTGGWQILGSAGLSACFLGDGNGTVWRDLKNGFTFAYSSTGDLGLFRPGGATARFAYYYTPGQWVDIGNTGGWQILGAVGRSAAFLGDGNATVWRDLGNGFTYQYRMDYDYGYFQRAAADTFYYAYAAGQWYDAVTGRGWKTLGATGRSAAFVGDGVYRDLGDGYQYKFEADRGYFLFDAAHTFRQTYSTGSWQYLHDGDQWSAWSSAAILKDINPSAGSSSPSYFVSGAFLYFIAYDGPALELYRYGSSFQSISGNLYYFKDLAYVTTLGTDLYFSGGSYAGGPLQYNLYRWNGTTFQNISGDFSHYFKNRWYFTSVGTDLYFYGTYYTNTVYSAYRWNGTTFQEIAGVSYGFKELKHVATVGSNVYFIGGSYLGGPLRYLAYRWNGTTFASIYGDFSHYFNGLEYLTSAGTDLYFYGTYYTNTVYSAYRWNGTTFQEIAGVSYGFKDLKHVATAGSNVYFVGGSYLGSALEYLVYRWNGTTFASIYGDFSHYFKELWYLTSAGTDLYFYGTYYTNTVYSAYRWNGTTFQEIAGVSYGFKDLKHVATVGGDVYFIGGSYLGGPLRYLAYRWNGTTFASIYGDFSHYFKDLGFLTGVGTDLYFYGTYYTNTVYSAYRWNGTTFQEIAGVSYGFKDLKHVATVGSDIYFIGGSYLGSALEYLVYRWNGTSFASISGDFSHYFKDLRYFTGVGTDLYFYGVYYTNSAYGVYRWNGTNFVSLSGLYSDPLGVPVIYKGDLYFSGSIPGYGTEPWRLWIAHSDFLSGRMP